MNNLSNNEQKLFKLLKKTITDVLNKKVNLIISVIEKPPKKFKAPKRVCYFLSGIETGIANKIINTIDVKWYIFDINKNKDLDFVSKYEVISDWQTYNDKQSNRGPFNIKYRNNYNPYYDSPVNQLLEFFGSKYIDTISKINIKTSEFDELLYDRSGQLKLMNQWYKDSKKHSKMKEDVEKQFHQDMYFQNADQDSELVERMRKNTGNTIMLFGNNYY
jgi:hypothetical protein